MVTGPNKMNTIRRLFASLISSFRDLLPIFIVIAFFQLVVLQQPIPNLGSLLIGTILVLLGLSLFIEGLNLGLFPLGETMPGTLPAKAVSAGCCYLPSHLASVPQWPNPH